MKVEHFPEEETMKKVALSFVLLTGVSVAHADVWGDYANSYTNYVNAQSAQADQAKADADQQFQDLQRKAVKLQDAQAKDVRNIQDGKTSVDSLKTTEAAIEAELAKLQATTPPPPKKFLFFHIKSAQEKQIEDAQHKLADIKKQLETELVRESSAEATVGKVASDLKQEQANAQAAQKVVDQKTADLQKFSDPTWQSVAAQNQAHALLEAQRDNTFDSKLLFTDLQTLQQKNKLTQLQAQALQQGWDTQLNGTLIGEYVNGQIKKAMASTCDPSFQNACAAGKVDAINTLINSRLNAAKAEDSPSAASTLQSTKTVSAPATVTPVTTAPAGKTQ
jgi:chromosome segregation ATPase